MPCRTLVLVLALGCFAGLGARPALADAAVPAGPAFATELDAVIAASSAVNAQSVREDREFLGAVLRRGEEYHYSVAPGQPGADRIRAHLQVPDGFELVALWHTHGGPAPERRFFSAVDGALVARTGLPLYLADYTGALRVLRPGAPRLSALAARQRGLPGRSGFAAGQELREPDGERVRIPTRAEPAMAVSN